MAKSELSYEYVVSTISVYGQDGVTVSFTQRNDAVGPGVYGTAPAPPPPASINLVLSREEASGVFPGDTYTVSFTKK